MKYPSLDNTPIKEIIFSISYDEIIDKECFQRFVEFDTVAERFKEIRPIVSKQFNISPDEGIKGITSSSEKGYHLINDNEEVLQLRAGAFSYHYLNKYCNYETVLENIIFFWNTFCELLKEPIAVSRISVRYINVIEFEKNITASHLIQLYPKQSNDRKILNFQNSVSFSYIDYPEYIINTISTQPPNENIILLDISVNTKVNQDTIELKDKFKPLQEIKNKVFFDSITAKALLKYIQPK